MPENSGPVAPRMTWGRRIKQWLKRLAMTAVVLIVLGAFMIGGAEHHTAKPSFCGSCHIMEPYYASWEADIHGGKLGIACVDCHYAPGERTTIKAKLRGLSQVASYVSGRYGSTRPRAHVSNLSCTTAKCHGDGAFMEKKISLGTVTFVHAHHLKYDTAKREAAEKEKQELTASFREQLGDERLRELEKLAQEAGPAVDRIGKMVSLATSWNQPVPREQLERFSQLYHRHVRITQLDDLQCTNCHSYSSQEPGLQRDGGTHHFSATTTSCFTCHFNNEGFNTGTNSCLLCHSLPTEQITVHTELAPEESARLDGTELTSTIKMDHRMMLERKVNCIACHADVSSEDSLVTRRDCERCHDQSRYFNKWKEPLTLELVTEYHQAHVAEQRAKCLDCHSEIHHQLVREADSVHTEKPGFISASISNCTYCHPNQHAEQINLLRGAGGSGVPSSTPNMMFGARTNCYGCHTQVAVDQLAEDAVSGCMACHGDKHNSTFEKWKLGIELSRTDAEQTFENAREMLAGAASLPPETRAAVSDLVNASNADLELVRRGNGLHNVTYAMELLDSVHQRCQEAIGLMEEAGVTATDGETESEMESESDTSGDSSTESESESDREASGNEDADAESSSCSEPKTPQ